MKTDPPFDYLGSQKCRSRKNIPSILSFWARKLPKRVQFLLKPLKSLFLRTANTEFHA